MFILATLRNDKQKKTSVSVIIPAFNEESTVGDVVKVVKSVPYIQEVIVVDDGSLDRTSQVAEEAGATVIRHVSNHGKGAAIKTGIKNSTGDIVVFIDADIQNLTSQQVKRMIEPILQGEADVTKTKFKRDAGRVTELTAKPLLNYFFPEIKFDQPLSGQFAAKRSFLNRIKLEDDYGVDVGIVLDADVRGMRVKEVDIGKIKHKLSSLHDLNIVATEVVRTIVNRANIYGRVTMIDTLGHYIRIGLLGLSLATLGFFCIFFLRFVPVYLGISISIIGIIIALFYVIKIIRTSINVFSRAEGKFQAIRSFFYMQSPILVSSLILLAMLTTILGAVHVEEGKISIEPASRNLILWTQPQVNRSIDLRGPYAVDSALENEFNEIRMPKDAMDTLEMNYGDSIFISNEKYSLNQTLPGEDNVMRIPVDARNYLGLAIGDQIPDSNLRNVYKNLYILKNLPLENNQFNLTIQEGALIKTGSENGRIVNIYIDDVKVTSTPGIFKNGSYGVYVDGVLYRTIQFDDANPQNTYYINTGIHVIKIEIDGEVKSNMEFSSLEEGRFLNFIFK